LLAQKGFQGPRQILEAEDGGFLAATSDEIRLDEIERDLGRVWQSDGVCFKPYACCGSNHSSIDAALDLMAEHRFTASSVRRVLVGISRVVERQTGFPYRPSTVLNAQMSLRFNIAVALVDGTALVDQFNEARIVDPVVCDLASRIDVEVDPEIDAVYPGRYAGVVTLVLDDGRQLRKRVDYSKGMPENRMTSRDLDAKFLSLAGAAVGARAAGDLLSQMAGIFETSNISGLARQLGALRLAQSDHHGGH
jgi:2-methylcitrate dehydratase PrpD